MKKNIRLFFIVIIFCFANFLFVFPEYAKADVSVSNNTDPIEYSTFYTYSLAKNGKDTIVAIRKLNKWWFGIIGGPNIGFSFGDLYSKWNPSISGNNAFTNQIVGFNNSFGWGYYAGLVGEYVPVGGRIGCGLRIIPLDVDIMELASDKMKDGFDTKFDFKSKLAYINITPYVRYNIPGLSGLHALAGFDAKINISSILEQIAKFENTGQITHKYEVKDIGANSRFGLTLGIAYDLFFADFFGLTNRIRLTPFVDFKFATDVITDMGSNWNNIGVKLGAQLKLSPDKVTYDTLIYDPQRDEVPVYYASARSEIGVEYPGRILESPPMVHLAMVEFPKVPERVPMLDTVIPVKSEDTNIHVAVNVPVTVPGTKGGVKPRIKINFDEPVVQNFSTSATTQLTSSQREDLDLVVQFLKENSNAIARIEGHSDNRGTTQQNTDRATARARNAMNYLISKGISRGRLFMQGRGALFPISTNDTEEGRRRNRRVEILIQNNR